MELLEGRVLLATQQLLANPSFSLGGADWAPTSDFYAGTNLLNYRTSPGYAAGGVSSTGAAKSPATGSISQQFTIPAAATAATLQFWYFITSDEAATAGDNDRLSVQLTTPGGTFLLTQYSNRQENTGYVQTPAYSLWDWRGQTVRLAFVASTNATLHTVFRIDDVTVTVTTPDVPNPPTNLETQARTNPNRVDLGWDDNSNNESGFVVERKTGATGTWGQLATVAPTSTNAAFYTDSSVTGGVTYFYRVYAYNAAGSSASTSEVPATVPLPLRITGEVTYRDVYGSDRRAAYVRVEAWERQSSGGDVLLATGSTAADGTYSLDRDPAGNLLLNVDTAPGETGTRDVYVKLRAENEAGSARRDPGAGGAVHEFQSPVAFDVPGATHVRDISVTSYAGSATSAEAWGVPAYLKQARDWLAANSSPSWSRAAVQTYIPFLNWPQCDGNAILLPENWRTWGDSTIAHEYGHAVQFEARGGSFPSGGGPDPHTITSVSSEGFALIEGWAEFFQHAVFSGGSGFQLEQNAYWFGPSPSGARLHLGNVVEGAVASVLWDLHDGVGDDGVAGRFNDAWRVLLDDDPDSIWNAAGSDDFYHYWNARYGRSRAVDEVFIDHGMPVADDPFENNDSLDSAYPLPGSRQTYPDLILADANDTFGFRIDGPAGEESYVRIAFDDLRGKLDLHLFDATFEPVASSAGDDNLERISLAGLTAGQYYLRVVGTNGDFSPDYDLTLNVVAPPNEPPQLAALATTPPVVRMGANLLLTATGVHDPEGQIASVSFYRDANNDGVGDAGELLGSDTHGPDDWSWSGVATWPAGTHTYLARATDAGSPALHSPWASATGAVTDDWTPPEADFFPVPDPMSAPVEGVRLQFTEDVVGLGFEDLRLTRDGGPNLLPPSGGVENADAATYFVELEGLTAEPGTYQLTLVAAGSGITDRAGNPLAAGASVSWTMLGQPDLVPYQPVSWSAPIVVSNLTGTTVSDRSDTGVAQVVYDRTVYLDLAFRNEGTGPTTGPVRTVIYFRDLPGQPGPIWPDPIESGETVQVLDFPWDGIAPTGGELRIEIDSDFQIDEQDETNNTASILAAGIEGGEPEILSFTAAPTSVHPGESVTFSVAVNTGVGFGIVDWVEYYLDGNGNGIGEEEESLGFGFGAAGGWPLIRAVDWPAGDHVYLARAVDRYDARKYSSWESTTGRVVQPTPPSITGTDPTAVHASGATPPIAQIGLNLSEPLDAASANAAANYELRGAGGDGAFGTGDDVLFALSPSYTPGATSALLAVSSPLTAGPYRLTVFAAGPGGGVRDASGLALDGDANGTAGGNYVRIFSVLNATPTNVSLSPDAATYAPGTFRSFAAQYRDANGAADIDLAYLRVRNPAGGVLTALYQRATNRLYLLAENGTTLLGGFVPGTANTITNSFGTLDAAGTTVSTSGDTLTVNWRISAKSPMAGSNSLQLFSRDRASAWSPVGNLGTWAVNGPPANVGVTPGVASDAVGAGRTFAAQYRDVNGAGDIDLAYLRVRNPATGAVLTAVYQRASNRIYLVAENGTTLLGGFAPGSANTITNSFGTLDVAGTTVTPSGDTLTINWRLSAKDPLIGGNEVQLFGRDRSNAWSPTNTLGSWSVARGPVAPTNVGVSPLPSAGTVGAAQTFTAQYQDLNGAGDIDLAYLRVRTASGAVLTALYHAVQDRLYLIAEDGVTLRGGFAPGSANTITHALGTLDVAGTTVSRVGNVLTVNWRLTPASPLVGSNTVQLFSRDHSNLWSVITTAGTWTVGSA